MAVKRPTIEDLADIAEGYALSLTEQDLESFQGLMSGVLDQNLKPNGLYGKAVNMGVGQVGVFCLVISIKMD